MTSSNEKPAGSHSLSKGANVGLEDLDSQLGSVTVVLETGDADGSPVDADVSVLLLGPDGRVGSNEDFVFYNQPIALNGAVHLRDTLRVESGDDADTGGRRIVSTSMISLDLDQVPELIERIVVGASIDASLDTTFGQTNFSRLSVQRASDGRELTEYRINDSTLEQALLFGEFYRRNGRWRLRAVGQDYEGGLAALAADFGVDIASAPAADPFESTDGDETPSAQPTVEETSHVDTAEDVEVTKSHPAQLLGAVSIRRAMRAPKMPAEWNLSVPVKDDSDYRTAELFPIAGIGSGIEQERRAASTLLAVMPLVRDFGRALVSKLGGPAGVMRTYIEVPFSHEERPLRPDGLIRITRGNRQWNALVEVKTAGNTLSEAQIAAYVDIARKHNIDAVVTISNQVTGADDEHPVTLDRRTLGKVALHHLSWDDIRTQAVLLVRHREISDPVQRVILTEFIRYMQHEKSGLPGFTDMGPRWVTVRDGIKSRTLKASDAATRDVSVKFDQLIRHVALHLTGLLGVDVQPIVPAAAPDIASRCQQLADSGLLFGTLRVPGAVNPLALTADLRSDQVTCSITVDAPRDGRPLTRVNWLLRQLSDARPKTRVEASTTSGRTWSTARHLSNVRDRPDCLTPPDGRDIRTFRVALDLPMGTKRQTGRGTLIGSVLDVTDNFYAEVVQHLRPWSGRAPKMPTTASELHAVQLT